jgi:hypothetical protein
MEPYYPSVSYEGMETIVEKEVTVTSEQTSMRQETFTENNNWEANRIKAVHIQNSVRNSLKKVVSFSKVDISKLVYVFEDFSGNTKPILGSIVVLY